MPYFEIEVSDTNGEAEFVTCEIFTRDNKLIAQRAAVSTQEEKSKDIAENSVEIDECFSLDEHLGELHSGVINSILKGDLYELTYE